MPTDYLKQILTARVYDVARETSLEPARGLSARTGNTILLKREDTQDVFSFKIRGAYNKMAHLTAAQLERGVITASAGNHAQGVALSAQRLCCRAVIFMPTSTPQIKIDAVTARGAEVRLVGDSFQESAAAADQASKAEGLTFVHPYDDPLVIAGQGTIGMEILRQHQHPIHAVFVPIGGGGLIAGIAAYFKALSPATKIIGVEPNDSCAMYQSVKAGKRVKLTHINLFADGVAVKHVGQETFRLVQQHVDDFELVSTDEICAAIKDIYQDTRAIMEPSGGLAVAAAKNYAAKHQLSGQTLVAICCGANMNFDRLRFVAERAELGEQREAIFAVTIPEQPGAFRALTEALTEGGSGNITEFNYRYADGGDAHVFLGVQLKQASERKRVLTSLKAKGFKALDLSDDEMAKLHLRHLVGGRSANLQGERLFRFEFPERPGALLHFLTQMGEGWNITLFHYRNHGADYGRVLVGLQVPKGVKTASITQFLKALRYEFVEETNNLAYKMFLG